MSGGFLVSRGMATDPGTHGTCHVGWSSPGEENEAGRCVKPHEPSMRGGLRSDKPLRDRGGRTITWKRTDRWRLSGPGSVQFSVTTELIRHEAPALGQDPVRRVV